MRASSPERTGPRDGSRRLAFALVALAASCARTSMGDWPGGIGAVLRHRASDNVLELVEAPDAGAAAVAGLRQGDVIVAIDGHAVATMDTHRIVQALRGRVGSRVVLRVRRGLQSLEVTVERAPYRGSQL